MPAAAILYFFRSQICNGQTVTRDELRHRAKFRWHRWNCGRDMAIFRFFIMAAADMLDFWNYKVLTVLTVGRIISVELRYRAKFRGDWSNRCRDISILDFSRWWQLPCGIFKYYILTIRTVKKDELRHCAKFRRNRSNRGWDMAIFLFFEMAAAAMLLDFRNFNS